jgi:glyoxylase-like metal-dependent hydrolase (beta-lactamase superfamily II)
VKPTFVGDLVVTPLFDGTAILEPAMFTAEGEPTSWNAHADLLDATGRLVVPVGAFVVRVGNEVVLLDAGVGNLQDEMFSGGALLESLASEGLTPQDITTVFVSHLHSDHCGWLESNGGSTFRNAEIRIGAADWDHYVTQEKGGAKRAARLRAVEAQVKTIDTDGESIATGITSRSTPGHTPGHTSLVISNRQHRLIVLGDALHCPAQLTETEWEFLFDVDRALAKATRQSLVREAEEPNTALLPMHFPGMTAARLVAGQAKKQWVMN